MGQSGDTGDQLAYLIEVSARLAPDKIQIAHEMEAWMDGLSAADLTELAQVYRRADAAGHMEAATSVLRNYPPPDVERYRRLRRLFSLFDHLGERGIAPFDSFRVGNRAVPEQAVDWSELPEDLRWVIAPAEKYGSLQFESRILDHIDAMDEAERVEVRALEKRVEEALPRLQSVGEGESLKVGTAAHRIYYLSMFLTYFGWDEDDTVE